MVIVSSEPASSLPPTQCPCIGDTNKTPSWPFHFVSAACRRTASPRDQLRPTRYLPFLPPKRGRLLPRQKRPSISQPHLRGANPRQPCFSRSRKYCPNLTQVTRSTIPARP